MNGEKDVSRAVLLPHAPSSVTSARQRLCSDLRASGLGAARVDDAAKLPHVEKVFLIGVGADWNRLPRDRRKKIVRWAVPGGEELAAAIPTEHVYISIDKDVLDRAFASTNWDHGTMHLEDLLAILQTLIRIKRILGIDICGELPVPPAEAWYYTRQLRLNERTNLSLLESILSA